MTKRFQCLKHFRAGQALGVNTFSILLFNRITKPSLSEIEIIRMIDKGKQYLKSEQNRTHKISFFFEVLPPNLNRIPQINTLLTTSIWSCIMKQLKLCLY